MKIIHFSDIHIHSKPILENNPVERFKLALKHVKNNHLNSDMFVITGDITHHGDLASYESFNEILIKAELPDHLYPKLIMGNHDDREIFKNYFNRTPIDQDGFVQYKVEQQEKRFLFLDTTNPKTHQGHYCLKRQDGRVCNFNKTAVANFLFAESFLSSLRLPRRYQNALV